MTLKTQPCGVAGTWRARLECQDRDSINLILA